MRAPRLTKAKIAKQDSTGNTKMTKCNGAIFIALNANRITDNAVRNDKSLTYLLPSLYLSINSRTSPDIDEYALDITVLTAVK